MYYLRKYPEIPANHAIPYVSSVSLIFLRRQPSYAKVNELFPMDSGVLKLVKKLWDSHFCGKLSFVGPTNLVAGICI
jgi:hypothetical protein